jgi:hypothetical protein
MQARFFVPPVLSLLLLASAAGPGRAADVVQQLPNDALGFIVVKNLAAADTKIDQLLTTIQIEFAAPLAFLKAVTGISEGLDPQGDMMFAVLPGAGSAGSPKFAVWLPVRDYPRLITSLDGAPAQPIVAVTVAGQDVLVGHVENWALLMDPDERERMEQLIAGTQKPRADLAKWNAWIRDNDLTAVALPKGIRTFLAWAASAPPAMQIFPAQDEGNPFDFGQTNDEDDLFAAADEPAATTNFDAKYWTTVRKWTTASPQLTEAILRAKLVGCALRLDENGNLHAGFRLSGFDERPHSANEQQNADAAPLPPALFQGGPFVLNAAGNLPPALTATAARVYVQAVIDELKTEANMQLRDTTVNQFQQAVDRASGGVRSVVLLTQPGDKQEGVYTNDFLVVRAASAGAFADDAKEVLRLWNTMNRDAEAATRLVFDVEETNFGDRTATQYSLDIAAADGAPELPEIRQAMEKLFGPGGKLRLWIVPVDNENVLLASATPNQLAAALSVLDRKQAVDWSDPELAAVNQMLPSNADWRLFFSPRHYNSWHRRQMDAITGPVLGGPLVKEFPSAPPIGVAGGRNNDELWIETAVPSATLKSTGEYLKK